MNRILLLVVGVTVLGAVYIVAPVAADSYRRFRRRKLVVCPDAGKIAELELNSTAATLLSALGKQWVRVKRCSLWPRQRDCAQKCLTNLSERRKGNHGE
jgi:hypothetical protein